MPTLVGLAAILLLMRAMRKQSLQEKNHLTARAHRHRLRRWAGRFGAVFTRRSKPHR